MFRRISTSSFHRAPSTEAEAWCQVSCCSRPENSHPDNDKEYENCHFNVQGGVFNRNVFNRFRPKSVRLHSKSLYKSSKSQNLLTSWHLKLFERNQFKNHPVVKKCSYLEEDVLMLELLLALWHPHLLHDLGLQGAHSVRQWHRHAKCLGYFKVF